MEGRTIVRPDPDRNATRPLSLSPFNGGPDNRPARHSPPAGTPASSWTLQWRAGQSSGQTFVPTGRNRLYGLPSMEGRTIVRPDPAGLSAAQCEALALQWRAGQSSGQTRPGNFGCPQAGPAFNGGPDNRPARQQVQSCGSSIPEPLQWRAGQSSGQTVVWGSSSVRC